jgi:hypothetical protein
MSTGRQRKSCWSAGSPILPPPREFERPEHLEDTF